MIYHSPENPNSHLTAKERKEPSFPTKKLLAENRILGDVLDFGCGKGADLDFLQKQGFSVAGFDPYYVPKYPDRKFDTILCNYVLNVLLPEEQAHVLMAVSELLRPSGKAYFSVRRDITKNGFRTHTIYGKQVYQCNVKLPYRSILNAKHCEVYEYQHINQRFQQNEYECIFCYPSSDRELITESATVYALLSAHPAALGHTLVIPKQHVSDYVALPERTRTACWLMIERLKTILARRFRVDSFTISVDIGETVASASPHTYFHLIPRMSSH